MITSSWAIGPWLMFWCVMIKALLVHAEWLPPTCRDCGRRLERGYLGERVCACAHHSSATA